MNYRYEEVMEILKKHNQEHLLAFYNELTSEEQDKLLEQIMNIDFEQIEKLYEETKNGVKVKNDLIEPIEYINKDKLPEQLKDEYLKIGEDVIKNNCFAVVTMAGGQRY